MIAKLLMLNLIMLGTAPASGDAELHGWQKYSGADDIRIHYRYSHGDTLEIQAETNVQSCAAAFLHLLEDTSQISNWASNTRNATILDQPADNVHVVHTVFKTIWPISSRDMVTRSEWQFHSDSQTLHLNIENASDALAPAHGVVRMTEVAANWRLQQGENGSLSITYQGYANPEGRIPRTIARRTTLRAIQQTFRSLGSVLADYQEPYHHIPCGV
ncbi:hypothetical protein CWE12_13110 [Aliidiomarina sedimenti]|uniref:START domain-containing protein n=1 Tax=Aliidiomarina sedimenti TaxID=1933879 RepID=A0ABY0BVS5_9GAMM|nr:START domain-containing protein [Aliidiomarina sedimenti]RUO28153.1 hypothetical protein CWE12_13110 [Aliidiomarina sedimenti]